MGAHTKSPIWAAMVLVLAIALLPIAWAVVCLQSSIGQEDSSAAALLAEPAGPLAALVTLPLREGGVLAFRPVVVTGYTSSHRETDGTPFLTASMTRVRSGCLALSRDLLRTFTADAPFDFGDWVLLPGVGVFIVEDTMHARWRNRADIWFPNRRQALRWGRRRALLARLPSPPEEGQGLFALGPLVWDRR